MSKLLGFNCPLCHQLECPINKHFVEDGKHPQSIFKWGEPEETWNVYVAGCWKCDYSYCSLNQVARETFKFHPSLFEQEPIFHRVKN